jgi:hypothetical protein
MRRFTLPAIQLAVLFLLAGDARADSVPDWVRATLEGTAAYDKGVPYIVLLDERVTTVKDNGKAETRARYIVRVLTQEGRLAARREIQYDSQTKISDLHAWHLRVDQKVFELESDKVIEQSIPDDLYSEIRSKVVRFGEVDIGSVVAFEWVQKEKPLVNQDYHFFQTGSPVVTSRYQLNLPAGWRVESFVFNHQPIKPVVTGNSYTWQLQELSAIKEDVWTPEMTTLSPCVAVSYFPPGGARKRTFSSWQDVSRWAEQLMQRPIRAPLVVEAKAEELTSGLGSEFEKVRAIGRWVQKDIRYVSIQLGAIGGYRPNAPDAVLRKGYGDCKDKSALMQAMLRAVGIDSHIVLVFSGDPIKVRPEFPSPLQFNHTIVAVDMKSDSGVMLGHPRLGRLLFFDPTDSVTPLGDLPYYLQGSYGLVVKGETGDLVKLPVRPEEANSVRRDLAVQVEASGEILAEVKETFTGQLASVARHKIESSSPEEYTKEVCSRVARDIPGAVVNDLKINRDSSPDEPLVFEYTIKASNYGNRLGRLLVIRPVLVWVQQSPVFTRAEREFPVLFEMKSVKEDMIRITLPEGFKLDEVPSNTEIKCGFGEFNLSYRANDRQVVVQRRLAINKQMVPAAEYAEIKKFFDNAQSASQSSLVLVSK